MRLPTVVENERKYKLVQVSLSVEYANGGMEVAKLRLKHGLTFTVNETFRNSDRYL